MSMPVKIDIAASHVGRVGCSEIAAALGVSSCATPYQLWRVKTGLDQPDDIGSELRVALGTPMEDVLRPFVAAKLGRELRRDNREFKHPTLPLIGHVDYRASSMNGEPRPVVDMKTSLGWGARHRFGDDGTDEVDQDVFLQMQGYLLLTGAEIAYVAALVPGPELKVYTIQADPELHQMIEEGIANFWRHVETDTPPDPATLEDASRRWPQHRGQRIPSDADTDALLLVYRNLKAELKAKEAQADAYELALKQRLGDCEALIDARGQPLCTWRTQSSTRLDTAALKDAGIYDRYTKTTTSRVFRLAKEKAS